MNIAVSFLPTKEDYAEFLTAKNRMKLSKKKQMFFLLLGIGLIVFGFVWKFLLSGKSSEMGIFLFFGILISAYYSLLHPMLLKTKALQTFQDHPEKVTAVTYIFEDETFSLKTDRYEGEKIPYSMLYGIKEEENVILLLFGAEEIRYIPKRAIQSYEWDQIKQKFNTV